jgi:fermentation-respiration switch protein FrsA (DUF1100 family)
MRVVAAGRWAGIAVTIFVLLLGLLWLFQRRLIYVPIGRDVPSAASVLGRGEDVVFRTADGLDLGGWFVPPPDAAHGVSVLILNGNAGNRAFRAPLERALAAHGFGVMSIDYRGYGGNPGRPTEEGLLADARAARRWLESRPETAPERVVLFGESLGAAVAVGIAAEDPPAALVLRSPFTSLVDAARFHYPFLPVGLMLADRYPSRRRIVDLGCPLLVIAGAADRIVPPEQSRALYDAAPDGRKRFLLLQGGHNDPELLAGERLVLETIAFIDASFGNAGQMPDGAIREPR